MKDRRRVELVDLAAFGRPARLVWDKRRWSCPAGGCRVGSFTEVAPHIDAARLAMTDRAGRWATEQVGPRGRPVSDLARELGCDWHTINDTVIACGSALVDDPDRIGDVDALGLGRDAVRSGRPLAAPGAVDVDHRRERRAAPRRGPGPFPPPAPARGWPSGTRRGWTRSGGPRWICRGRGVWRSTRCSRPRPRSRIRSTW